jgi:hypothetical protein
MTTPRNGFPLAALLELRLLHVRLKEQDLARALATLDRREGELATAVAERQARVSELAERRGAVHRRSLAGCQQAAMVQEERFQRRCKDELEAMARREVDAERRRQAGAVAVGRGQSELEHARQALRLLERRRDAWAGRRGRAEQRRDERQLDDLVALRSR